MKVNDTANEPAQKILNARHVYQPSSIRTYAKRALKGNGIWLNVKRMTTVGIAKRSSTNTSEIDVNYAGSKQGEGLEGCTPLPGTASGENPLLVR